MSGAVVWGLLAYWLSKLVGRGAALAVFGAVVGVVWAEPHLPDVHGNPMILAQAVTVLIGLACVAGVVVLWRLLRGGRSEEEQGDSGVHGAPDSGRARAARVPNMLSLGVRQVWSLAAQDMVWAGDCLGRAGRAVARWAARGRDVHR